MICQNCQNEVTPGNSYCNHCGTKIAVQSPKFFGNCGSQLLTDNMVCLNCASTIDRRIEQQVQLSTVQYQQPVVTAPTYLAQQKSYVGQNHQHPSEYFNIKKIRTWSGINLLLSPILGIWGYMLIKKIETAPNEMMARKFYKKATNICVLGSFLGLIAVIIYSGM